MTKDSKEITTKKSDWKANRKVTMNTKKEALPDWTSNDRFVMYIEETKQTYEEIEDSKIPHKRKSQQKL